MTDDEWVAPFAFDEEVVLEGPEAPENPPEPALVVLGRFQPFHLGHANLVEAAFAYAEKASLACRIVIGSANKPESLDNPWTWQEREVMIRGWLDANYSGKSVDIVAVPDINDPPNWVSHAEQYHGGPGVLFTSDGPTTTLYCDAGWEVVESPLQARESWEGWRIRSTLKMLSTVSEQDAALSVMLETIQNAVASILLDEGWLKRLAFLGRPFEPVG